MSPKAKTKIQEIKVYNLINGKPSKSSLIGASYKDNLYLGTNTIENENPHPTNWFANEKYKDDATKSVVVR